MTPMSTPSPTKTHTLFIDNLPMNFNRHDLQRLFSHQGSIVDAFVPLIQRRRVFGRFGFIEVHSRQQGDRMIMSTNGKLVGRQVIKVQWAKYPRRSRRVMGSWHSRRRGEQSRKWDKGRLDDSVLNCERWRPKAKVTTLSGEFVQQNKTAKVVQLEKVNENLEWLDLSLICISDVPRDVEVLRSRIQAALSEKILIRDLGRFKFLLSMESKEVKERVKKEGEGCLKQWFFSIKEWAEEDVCESRRLWLEIVGIPLHLWSEQNIKQIAGNWGDVVYIEKDSIMKTSFASAKVVIDSLCTHPIEDEAIIQDGVKGFRISVFEAKTEFTIFHMGPLDDEGSLSSMKIRCSQKMDGRGSINDEVEGQADLEQLDRREVMSHAADRDRRGVQQATEDCGHLNSNLNDGINEGGHPACINGTSNSPAATTVKGVALKHIHFDELQHGLSGIEADNRATLKADRDLTGRKLDEAISEIGSSASSRPSSKDDRDLIGNCSVVVPEALNSENEVHRVELKEQLGNAGSVSSSSRSRTKTAQLSGNDYSEELAKIYNRGLTEEDEEVNKLNSRSEGNSLDVPPGFNPVIGTKYGEDSCEATLHRKKKVTKQYHTQSTKRMTRSQTKQGTGLDSAKQMTQKNYSAGKARRDVSAGRDDSAETTESMLKLANEALEIGEMLGIKVIDKKENALKSITSSLKKKKRSL